MMMSGSPRAGWDNWNVLALGMSISFEVECQQEVSAKIALDMKRNIEEI